MRRAVILLIAVAFLSCKSQEAATDTVMVSETTMDTAPLPDTPTPSGTIPTETMATDTSATSATMEPTPPVKAMLPPPPRPMPSSRPRTAPPPSPAAYPSIREVELRDYVKVPVYFATTRGRAANDSRNVFGAGRTDTHYGLSWVSIPRSHEAGELEEPSVFTLTFREDPAKHVVLLEVRSRPKERWYSELKTSIAEAGTKQAFVFVHGFNVAFADASRRTAQIKYDLGFDGPAILFSWPSHGKKALYLADEANAEWSVPKFAAFLVELREQTGPNTDIHIIAHSLGNRVLSRALEKIDLDARITPKPAFSQIVLAAPDMDAEVFRDQLAPSMRKVARGITLYGSSDDRALVASKTAHQVTRAGEGGPNLPILTGIDSIDVTGMDTSFLAHSYIGTVSVLGDVAQIFCEKKAVGQRYGVVARNPAGWRMISSPEKRAVRPCRGR